jgi:hypothetical protein
LATQSPDQEQSSLYSIEGGDAARLMLKLTAGRDRWAKVSDALTIVTLCYEVRYDAFWLVVIVGNSIRLASEVESGEALG